MTELQRWRDGVLAAHQQVLDAHQQALARRSPSLPRSRTSSTSGVIADLQARLQSKEAEIDVLKATVASRDTALDRFRIAVARRETEIDVLRGKVEYFLSKVASLDRALEASRQQTSAASLEALEPRSLGTDELAALNEALPRATEAVTREVSRRLTAGAAETREVEDEALCICCLDRPRDIVFLSCNHMIVCEQCAQRTAFCPTCRVPITEKRRIFR